MKNLDGGQACGDGVRQGRGPCRYSRPANARALVGRGVHGLIERSFGVDGVQRAAPGDWRPGQPMAGDDGGGHERFLRCAVVCPGEGPLRRRRAFSPRASPGPAPRCLSRRTQADSPRPLTGGAASRLRSGRSSGSWRTAHSGLSTTDQSECSHDVPFRPHARAKEHLLLFPSHHRCIPARSE